LPRFDQRQTDRSGLRMQHVATDAVHRDAIVFVGDGRQQADDIPFLRQSQRVQRPRRILAAAP